jgi:hypothetical protein
MSKKPTSFWDKTKKVLIKVAKNMKEAQNQSEKIASKEEVQSLARGITKMNENLIGTAKVNYNNSLSGTSGVKFPDFEQMSGVTGKLDVPDTRIKVKAPKFVDNEKVEYVYDEVEQKQIRVKRGKDGRYDVIPDGPEPKVREDFLLEKDFLTGTSGRRRRS